MSPLRTVSGTLSRGIRPGETRRYRSGAGRPMTTVGGSGGQTARRFRGIGKGITQSRLDDRFNYGSEDQGLLSTGAVLKPACGAGFVAVPAPPVAYSFQEMSDPG